MASSTNKEHNIENDLQLKSLNYEICEFAITLYKTRSKKETRIIKSYEVS